ncbi:hypothetical protein M7I_2616 [Glarea lozoyensis 74030]|uniref:Uncharacterized protein n=1 Tax=Glarea lozoyensis (strain ATCC 74030 / MF5533) TaxID=1104152 RepID=H0EJ78_GLAL7|nr:hypothetical protein M7I_2616 [Glarea lozoyensis 74030]
MAAAAQVPKGDAAGAVGDVEENTSYEVIIMIRFIIGWCPRITDKEEWAKS